MKIEMDVSTLAYSIQPVMLIDSDGRLSYANLAAQSLLPMFIEYRPLWTRELANVTDGNVELPHQFDAVNLPAEIKHWIVWITRAEPDRYALLFIKPTRSRETPPLDELGFRLIGKRMQDELKSFAESLRATLPSLKKTAVASEHFELMTKTQRLSGQLDELALLSELHEGKAFNHNDRISLFSTMKNLIDEQQRSDADSDLENITLEIDPTGALLAPVYGNKHLLTMALRAFLHKIIISARNAYQRKAKVQVLFRQLEGYAFITLRTRMSDNDVAPSAKDQPSGSSVDAIHTLSIAISERILLLHGAKIRLAKVDNAGYIDSVVISLPTSHPVAAKPDIWCQDCPAFSQSVAFAKDLAVLMGDKLNDHPLT